METQNFPIRMALNFTTVPGVCPKHPSYFASKHRNDVLRLPALNPPCLRLAATGGGAEGGVTEAEPSTYSARMQLDLLEQLASSSSSSVDGYESDGSSRGLTIRDQLTKLVGERDDDFSIPLGKNLKKFTPKFLTTSQKRNIRRQAYMNEVSQRNDSVFFATIGAFVILPPVIILGIAIATGYVQLFP